MIALAREGSSDVTVRETALSLVRSLPSHDHKAELLAIFRFVRDRIRFTSDIHGIETLQGAAYTLRVGQGDCDDRAVLLAALSRSIGLPVDFRFRVVAAEPGSNQFTHVYPVARIDGEEIPLDPTYGGNQPGVEYPGGALRREDGPTMSYRNLGVIRMPASITQASRQPSSAINWQGPVRIPAALLPPTVTQRAVTSILRSTKIGAGPPNVLPRVMDTMRHLAPTMAKTSQMKPQRPVLVPTMPNDPGLEPTVTTPMGGRSLPMPMDSPASLSPPVPVPIQDASDSLPASPSVSASPGQKPVTGLGVLALIGVGLMLLTSGKRPRSSRRR